MFCATAVRRFQSKGVRRSLLDHSRLSRGPVVVVIALVMVAAAWGAWATWHFSSFGRPQPQLTAADQRREVVFARMVAAMQTDRFTWRTVDRLAIEAGLSEAEAHEILAAHSNDIVLGKSREGKVIARLRQR